MNAIVNAVLKSLPGVENTMSLRPDVTPDLTNIRLSLLPAFILCLFGAFYFSAEDVADTLRKMKCPYRLQDIEFLLEVLSGDDPGTSLWTNCFDGTYRIHPY